MIVGAMVLTMERFRHVDFTMAILDGGWDILLPYPPTLSFNGKAIVKPFTAEVSMAVFTLRNSSAFIT